MSIRTMLTDRIDLEIATLTVDGGGGHTAAFDKKVRVRASVQPMHTREVLEYAKLNKQVSHKVFTETNIATVPGTSFATIPDLINGSQRARIVFKKNGQTRYFDIKGVRDTVEMNRLTGILADEQKSAWWSRAL